MTDYIAEFLEDIECSQLSPKVKQKYNYVLTTASTILPNLTKATSKELYQVIDHFKSEVGRTTLVNYLTCINQFYDYLVVEEVIDDNPLPRAKKRRLRGGIKGQQNYRRALNLPEIRQLLQYLRGHNKIHFGVVLFLAKTGIRIDELRHTEIQDIVWTGPNRGSYTVKPHPKRTNCDLWLDEETVKVLEDIKGTRTVGPVFVNGWGNAINEDQVNKTILRPACTKLGIVKDWSNGLDKITAHCFRHSFTTIMMEQGMNSDMIEEYRGDLRRGTRNRYYHIHIDKLKAAYLASVWEYGL